ncbi:hypothetical protein PG985_001856 [Apiospora marii]|uniref:uncharacterized protein n=1 Tax=Apiospora marii TaxID=335849 RepID=UPI0031324497
MADSPKTASIDSLKAAQDHVDNTGTAVAPSEDEDSEDIESEYEAKREASVAEEYREYVSGDKPPEYGAEGLVTLRHPSDEPAADATSQYDIVVVHGLMGARRPPWKNPGSGNSAWIDTQSSFARHHLMSFGYDASMLAAGRNARFKIHEIALGLLRELSKERSTRDKVRPIIFVAHDIGCIIVKEALVRAGLDPKSFGGIFDFTRVLLFYGCPHRARGLLDMQQRLSQFIYKSNATAQLPPGTTGSIPHLAEAVQDVNNLFFESKHYYHCAIVSVYWGDEVDGIDHGFDIYCGTMGVPFESAIEYKPDSDEAAEKVGLIMKRVDFRLVSSGPRVGDVRALLAAAPSLVPMATSPGPTHPFARISENEAYTSWLEQRKPKLLYLTGCGGDDARAASEYVFYDLSRRHHSNFNQLVLYFTFDRHDARRNNIQHMLTTFIAQIIGHFRTHYIVASAQFDQLRLQRSWSHEDLLIWFDLLRLYAWIDGISCVINHLDECDSVSSKAFLDFFAHKSTIQEHPWKLFITCREDGLTLRRMSEKEWPAEDVVELELTERGDSDSVDDLVHEHPELWPYRGLLHHEVASMAEVEPGVRRMVIDYMTESGSWSESRTIYHTFGPTQGLSLKNGIQTILSHIPRLEMALFMLSWILHSPRPPSASEMREAILYDDLSGLFETAIVYSQETASVEKVLEGLAGIVSREGNDLIMAQREIRDLLMSHPWTTRALIRDKPHEVLGKICVAYLSSESTKRKLEDFYDATEHEGTHMVMFPERSSLLNYAVEFCLYHVSQAAKHDSFDIKACLGPLMKSKNAKSLLAATWALANPYTRSHQPHTNIYTALVGAGLCHVCEIFRHIDDEDKSKAMVEAFLHGHSEIAAKLLVGSDHTAASLEQGLVAAGAYGDESSWLFLIKHIKAHYPEYPWHQQGQHVARASWLGLGGALDALIGCGCPLEEPDPINPLRLAIRANKLKAVKILLEHKADPNLPHKQKESPLHLAAKSADPKIVELLVRAGANLESRDDLLCTPVYKSGRWGNYGTAKFLINEGVDLDITSSDVPENPGWSPLTAALSERHLDCARALLEGGADPNIMGPGGPAIIYAVGTRSLDICKLLVEKGADVSGGPSYKSWSPLTMVLVNKGYKRRLEMVKLLIQLGASVNSSEPSRRSPLLEVFFIDDPDRLAIMELLLEHGANINHEDDNGFSPAHMAVSQSDMAMTRRLLKEEGLELNCPRANRWTPLKLAIAHAGIDVVTLLLDKGADPNLHHANEESPMMAAVRDNKVDVARLLIERGASINTAGQELDDAVWYPLEWAARYGQQEMIRLLGDNGADMACRWADGRTLVHKAIEWPGLATVLEFRPDVNALDKLGRPPLHEIDINTPLDNIKLLLRAGADLNMTDAQNITPLLEALRSGNTDAAEYLLTLKPDVNIATLKFGSPLHVACKLGSLKFVKALVDLHADVNSTVSNYTGTPLLSTFSYGHWYTAREENECNSIVDLLVEHGADVAATRGSLGTVVGQAAFLGTTEMVHLAIAKGGRAGTPDTMGRLPLHLASLRGELERVEILLDAGEDVTAMDKTGRTALHWAAQGGNLNVLGLILTKVGPTGIDQQDGAGWTPLCWAARGCGNSFLGNSVDEPTQIEVLKRLVEKGADAQHRSALPGKAWTPLDIATYHDRDKGAIDFLASAAHGLGDEKGTTPLVPANHRITSHNAWCDCCFSHLAGLRYRCLGCLPLDFDFCYKCYAHRSALHDSDHAFEEIGPEFTEESPPEGSRAGSERLASEAVEESSTESSSDSDSDDESDSGERSAAEDR